MFRNNPPYRQSRTRRMAGGSGEGKREKKGWEEKEMGRKRMYRSEGHGQGRD